MLQGFVGCSFAWAGGVGQSRSSLKKHSGWALQESVWGYSGSRDCLRLALDGFFGGALRCTPIAGRSRGSLEGDSPTMWVGIRVMGKE